MAVANRADREHPGRDQQEHRHDEHDLRVELQGTREEQQLQDDDCEHGADGRRRSQSYRSRGWQPPRQSQRHRNERQKLNNHHAGDGGGKPREVLAQVTDVLRQLVQHEQHVGHQPGDAGGQCPRHRVGGPLPQRMGVGQHHDVFFRCPQMCSCAYRTPSGPGPMATPRGPTSRRPR